MRAPDKKRIIIVTNSASYEPRAEKVGAFFEKTGYDVLWIESDFIHREKKKERENRPGHLYVDTVPYKKNMSVRRLYSQYDFAQKAYRLLKRLLDDQETVLLYVLIPANSLASVAAKLKAEHHLKLVFDIIDLWPESLPVKRLKGSWPVECWRRLRDDYLCEADLVLTECRLYQRILGLEQNDAAHTAALYWPKDQEAQLSPFCREDDFLHIVYLGSINHIIDMDMIVQLLSRVDRKKKVKFHVIGDGESRDGFMKKLRESRIDTEYYGVVYDEARKREIFSRSSFAVNIMKPGICVGLTMKSIDYFCYGVPLINNIPGDTWEMVEKYGVGVNCTKEDVEGCALRIVETEEKMQEKRGLMQKLYKEMFTVEALEKVLAGEVMPLLGNIS